VLHLHAVSLRILDEIALDDPANERLLAVGVAQVQTRARGDNRIAPDHPVPAGHLRRNGYRLLICAVIDNRIAFDGDGDRVIMVDHLGNIVDGDEILYVIARERSRLNVDFGGVVGTAMSNLGLELALDALDIAFVRSAVGDRYVMQELLQRGWALGGESSGHIICLDKTSTGDGIISALQTLAAIVNSGQPLAEITRKMSKLPQTMINVRITDSVDISANKKVQSAVSDIESKLGKNGRVLLRSSGTEPVVRVMVEGEDIDEVAMLALELSELVTSEVGSDR